MQRIVELGKAPEESSERFDQMLQTAVEQFNQGATGRAVSILESAHQLVLQERIPPCKPTRSGTRPPRRSNGIDLRFLCPILSSITSCTSFCPFSRCFLPCESAD